MFSSNQKETNKARRFKQQKENNRLFIEYEYFGTLGWDVADNDPLQNWQDIPDRVIDTLYDVLSFLDEKGYRFYLPAYMIWTIENYKKSDSSSSEYTLYSLIPSDFNLSRRQFFTWEQSQAICQFVSFMAIYDDYEQIEDLGILKYWQQFCQPFLINEVYYQYNC